MPPRGRLIAVDVGGVRVGLALCDADRTIVSPLETLYRKNVEIEGQFFRRVVRDEQPVGFVVGLPIHMSGQESTQSAKCRKYGDWLKSVTGLPVAYWDERCTSAAAESMLWEAGLSHCAPQGPARPGRRDALPAKLPRRPADARAAGDRTCQ